MLEARENLAYRRDGSEVGPEAHLQVWAGLSQVRGAGDPGGQNWDRWEKGREIDLNTT